MRLVRGQHNGIPLTFIDTPGLHASAARVAENKAILRGVRAAYRRHKPDYIFYVDRWGAERVVAVVVLCTANGLCKSRRPGSLGPATSSTWTGGSGTGGGCG